MNLSVGGSTGLNCRPIDHTFGKIKLTGISGVDIAKPTWHLTRSLKIGGTFFLPVKFRT